MMMSLKVSRILHAGYIFEYQGVRIVFDPIFENPFSHNCYAFPDVKFDFDALKHEKFDAVFISHHHDDHFSLESLDLLDRKTPIYVYCIFPELLALVQRLGFENVHHLDTDSSVHVGEIEITPRLALDPDVDSIFHINAGGINVLNVVDSWIDPSALDKLKLTKSWDLVLWPFQTMLEIEVLAPFQKKQKAAEIPFEWIEQLQMLNPKNVIPSSCQFKHENWSWYNKALFPISYASFEKVVGQALPKSKIFRLNPSESILLTGDSLKKIEKLTWVYPIGNQDLDYEFDSDVVVSTTAEIAKKFPKLGDSDDKIVRDYCEHGILERFRQLPKSEEEYFSKPFTWQLSIYNSLGEVKEYFYEIDCQIMKLVFERPKVVFWSTEIPSYKLFSALREGESLTSIYIRVNCNSDPMEDPLIRCLFSGIIGAYQIAQLKRIDERKI